MKAEALYQFFEVLPKGEQQRFCQLLKDNDVSQDNPKNTPLKELLRRKILAAPKRTVPNSV